MANDLTPKQREALSNMSAKDMADMLEAGLALGDWQRQQDELRESRETESRERPSGPPSTGETGKGEVLSLSTKALQAQERDRKDERSQKIVEEMVASLNKHARLDQNEYEKMRLDQERNQSPKPKADPAPISTRLTPSELQELRQWAHDSLAYLRANRFPPRSRDEP